MGRWFCSFIPLAAVCAAIGPSVTALQDGPAVPKDETERCSLLLEICSPPEDSAPSPSGGPDVHRTSDIVPILLEVADHDLGTIRKAVADYRGRGKKFPTLSTAREDLLRVLANTVWNVPDHEDGWAPGQPLWPLAYDKDRHLVLIGKYPSARTGVWLGFTELDKVYTKMYGKRELRQFASQRLSRDQIDKLLLEAMKDVPFKNGHWQF